MLSTIINSSSRALMCVCACCTISCIVCVAIGQQLLLRDVVWVSSSRFSRARRLYGGGVVLYGLHFNKVSRADYYYVCGHTSKCVNNKSHSVARARASRKMFFFFFPYTKGGRLTLTQRRVSDDDLYFIIKNCLDVSSIGFSLTLFYLTPPPPGDISNFISGENL